MNSICVSHQRAGRGFKFFKLALIIWGSGAAACGDGGGWRDAGVGMGRRDAPAPGTPGKDQLLRFVTPSR